MTDERVTDDDKEFFFFPSRSTANVQGAGACGLTRRDSNAKSLPSQRAGRGVGNRQLLQPEPDRRAGRPSSARNLPTPGEYRVRVINGELGGVYKADIHFTEDKAWPDPGQVGYKATNMKFWSDLAPFSRPGINKLTASKLKGDKWKRRYDTIVITNAVFSASLASSRSGSPVTTATSC